MQKERVNLAGIERQAVALADREYVTVSKQVTQNTELNFNWKGFKNGKQIRVVGS